MKKKVLISAGFYLPSIKGGGPIQSIKNLVDNLSDQLDFYIIAADRDLGDEKPFNNIKINEWVAVGKAKVFYTDISTLTWKKTVHIINSIDYDVIYLNSFFSYKFSTVPVILNKLKRISRKPIIMAPRGQFSPGALGLKSRKKKLFIRLTKALGIYKDIIWHATAEIEKADIKSLFYKANIKVANNLTANYKDLSYDKQLEKRINELKIVFISRIHPKKNLKKAIEFLKSINGKIEFNIFGPIEDKIYWEDCKKEINKLPSNIKVSYKGIIDHDNILETFKEHHIFLFPTLGENFGHVISEALIGGCPVILSDQTPWRGLKKNNAGWDINLENEMGFCSALQECVNLDNERYNEFSKLAFQYGKIMSNKTGDILKSYTLFEDFKK